MAAALATRWQVGEEEEWSRDRRPSHRSLLNELIRDWQAVSGCGLGGASSEILMIDAHVGIGGVTSLRLTLTSNSGPSIQEGPLRPAA